jgi:peptidoglycan/LPS O-acetylase OafA/YrhL
MTDQDPAQIGTQVANSQGIKGSKGESVLPGFDSLRLIGALTVILSHSYLIAQDTEGSEPLQQLLQGDKNIAGLYGVFMFFIISGFLLARSLHRNPSPVRFLVNRAVRLLPGFIACTLVVALVIAPLCSSLGVWGYFATGEWIQYISQSIITIGDAPLPGVFNYVGSVAQVVTGSLWSLQAEVLSYGVLLGLWLLLPSPGWVVATLSGIGLAILLQLPALAWLPGITYPLPYFAAGVLMWWLTQHLGHSRTLAQFCTVGLITGAILGIPHQAFAGFGAYLVVHLGHQTSPIGRWIERTGDLSYGLYLFGWPIQQALRQMLDLQQPELLFVLSTLITALFAWVLFHTVERPALCLRKPILEGLKRRIA